VTIVTEACDPYPSFTGCPVSDRSVSKASFGCRTMRLRVDTKAHTGYY
jgi:hypothetical protein